MMTPTELDARLLLWGRVMGQRGGSRFQEERSLTGNSTLAQFGRPDGYQGIAEGRHGRSRRMRMAQAAGGQVVGLRVVSTAFVDPVPCSGTRAVKAPDYDPAYTREVERVQSAWLVMWRNEQRLAMLLRIQYQEFGQQHDKAKALGMTVKRYKDELRLARTWMMARLAD